MKIVISLILCVAAVSTVGGEFLNLTFNQPDFSRLRSSPSGAPVGPVGDLLRGWEVSIRAPGGEWSVFREEIEFVFDGGGPPPIALDRGLHLDRTDYSVFFNSRPTIGIPPNPVSPDVRLSTTGTVPEHALTFEWYRGTSLELTISDGFSTLSAVGNPGPMNVSQFAGKEVTISFLQRSGDSGKLDVAGFNLVPEPELWALFGVGLVGLFAWYQCKRS